MSRDLDQHFFNFRSKFCFLPLVVHSCTMYIIKEVIFKKGIFGKVDFLILGNVCSPQLFTFHPSAPVNQSTKRLRKGQSRAGKKLMERGKKGGNSRYYVPLLWDRHASFVVIQYIMAFLKNRIFNLYIISYHIQCRDLLDENLFFCNNSLHLIIPKKDCTEPTGLLENSR